MNQEPGTLEGFVVLEGLDGSGTTTQLRLLDERLAARGIPHECTYEPTDRTVGRLVRDVLEHRVELHPETVALLFAADRSDHLRGPDGIIASARAGKIVITDRYLFSSLAYQGLLCGLDFVASINHSFPLPQAAIFLDAPPEMCQDRRSVRGRPDLYEDLIFQRRVRESYLRVFERYRGSSMRLIVLDGAKKTGELTETIWTLLLDLSIIRA